MKRKYRTDVAVDFFRSMLRRIGCETEVPIYNLYEYRVQATPEIRQESGHCVEDFQRFLRRHPEAFIVNCNDTVLLTRTESKPQPTHERAAMVSLTQQAITAVSEQYLQGISKGTKYYFSRPCN